MLLKLGLLAVHKTAVGAGEFGGLQPHPASALKVNELVGTSVVVEVQLMGAVEGMKEDDFMLVVAQVSEGVEKRFALLVVDEGIGENYHERAPVELLGDEV